MRPIAKFALGNQDGQRSSGARKEGVEELKSSAVTSCWSTGRIWQTRARRPAGADRWRSMSSAVRSTLNLMTAWPPPWCRGIYSAMADAVSRFGPHERICNEVSVRAWLGHWARNEEDEVLTDCTTILVRLVASGANQRTGSGTYGAGAISEAIAQGGGRSRGGELYAQLVSLRIWTLSAPFVDIARGRHKRRSEAVAMGSFA